MLEGKERRQCLACPPHLSGWHPRKALASACMQTGNVSLGRVVGLEEVEEVEEVEGVLAHAMAQWHDN